MQARKTPVARGVEIVEKAGGKDWLKPVNGYITSPYGERINPINGKEEFHNGLDVACENGTPARAVADGKITACGNSPTWGNYLQYDVGGGYSIFYAHLSSLLVNEGKTFKKGQILAKTGDTGFVTGPHLHLTVYENGSETDPLTFFDWEF